MLSLNRDINPQRPRLAHERTFGPDEKVIARHLGEIGWGIFATADFEAGETIIWLNPADPRGKFAPWHAVCDSLSSEFGYIMVPGFYWLPDETHPFCYFNHSCEQNCGFTNWGRIEDQGVRIIAYRSIRQGEQLTLDYALFTSIYETGMDGQVWSITPCLCGSPNCRGTIAALERLPLADQVSAVLPKNSITGRVLAHMLPNLPTPLAALHAQAPDQVAEYLEALQSQIAYTGRLYSSYKAVS